MANTQQYSILKLTGCCDRVICLYSNVGDFTELLTQEEAIAVSSAVVKRRREYSTGRWLARHALSHLGQNPEHLLSGAGRQPLWQEGITGSITHTDTCAAVVVANSADYVGIGIDMEHVGGIDLNMLPKLLTVAERENLNGIDPTLLFSAKEACYKLLYPIVAEYVDFQEVEVSVEESGPFFSLRYIGSSAANAIVEQARGMYMQLDNHWITCVILPRN